MMKNKTFTISLIVIGFLFLCFSSIVYSQPINTDISIKEDDFSLVSYREKAGFNESHIMNIEYSGKEILSKDDISYRVVGNREDVEEFNRCVDLSFDYIGKELRFIGEVKEYGVYSVDVQPVIKDSLTLSKYAWFNSSWKYKTNITFNSSQIETTETNFPVCIKTDDTECGYDDIQNDGDDIMFIDEDLCIKLNHEIEWFQKGMGNWRVIAWVNVTELPHDVDKTIWLYYGNSTCNSQESPTSDVFGDGFSSVWHFIDEKDNLSSESCTNVGVNFDDTNSIFADSADFEAGDHDRIDMGDGFSSTETDNGFTIGFWLRLESDADFEILTLAHRVRVYYTAVGNVINLNFYDGSNPHTLSTSISIEQWYHIVFYYDGTGDAYGYLDGVLFDSASGTNDPASYTIGRNWGAWYQEDEKWYDGRIEEAWWMLDTHDYSGNFIKTWYNSQNNASDGGFYDISSCYTNNLPVVVNPVPANESIDVPINQANWCVNISDDWTNFNYTIECSNGDTVSVGNSSNGTKCLTFTGNLICETNYTVWVNVTEYNYCNNNEGRTVYYSFWFITENCEQEESDYVYNFNAVTKNETLCPCCISLCYNVSFNSSSFNITINSNYTGTWKALKSFTHTKNNTYCFIINNWTNYNYTYYFNYTYNNGIEFNNTTTYYMKTDFLNNCIYLKEGDNMEISLATGLLGIFFTLVIFYLAFKVDEEEKKNIWKPILFFMDVPVALAVGISMLGNSANSINWWIGIFMFIFAIILSMAGLYYGLNFGRK